MRKRRDKGEGGPLPVELWSSEACRGSFLGTLMCDITINSVPKKIEKLNCLL